MLETLLSEAKDPISCRYLVYPFLINTYLINNQAIPITSSIPNQIGSYKYLGLDPWPPFGFEVEWITARGSVHF